MNDTNNGALQPSTPNLGSVMVACLHSERNEL